MRKLASLFLALSLTWLATGCATRTKMAFENESEKLSDKKNPVLLMTATLKNDFKPRYQPKLLVVNVEKPNAQDKESRLNFVMDPAGTDESGNGGAGYQYLIRMELEPGSYEIRGLTSLASAFPINAFFFTPMLSPLEVKSGGVYYLGNVTATVRERKGEEFKAGPTIPLLDQALAGASGGSFDVLIQDSFATDEVAFRNKFPALKDAQIQKSILPAFDRAKAQAFWEKN